MARLRSLTCALALGFTMIAGSSAARADDPKPTDHSLDGIGTATDPNADESGDDSVNDDPSAADAETTKDDASTTSVAKKARTTKATYPVELVNRPMTLTQNTAEIAIDAPMFFGGSVDAAETTAPSLGARATQVLHAAYGVTQDLQVGVSYGFGTERLSPPMGVKGFEAGKAFSVDSAYTIVPDHLAVSLSLPFYADPFAMSITIGAPFKVNVTDEFALVGGQDLVEISTNKWPVRTSDPEFNLDEISHEAVDVPYSTGAVNVQFGGIVQLKKNVAIFGGTRLHFEDFKGDDLPVPLFLGLTWSKWNLDLGGRLGFARLDESGSFGIALSAAYRL